MVLRNTTIGDKAENLYLQTNAITPAEKVDPQPNQQGRKAETPPAASRDQNTIMSNQQNFVEGDG